VRAGDSLRAMITFNEDGSSDIDFPNSVVHVKPPTFGSLKRLRAARVQFAREAQDKITAWEAEHPEPQGEGEGDEATPADPVAVARHVEDRIVATEEANLEATEKWWRLLLIGDESFKALADGNVPDNVDDWPAAMLYDVRPIPPAGATVEMLLSSQSAPDRWVRHVANFRSSSGPTNGQAPSPPNP